MASGSIVIDLLMKTGSFETDTKRAEKSLNNLRKEATEMGKAVGIAFSVAAVAATALVKQSIDGMDKMSELAQTTGVSVENLSSLAYAAKMGSVDLDTLSSSLVKLSKGMSDAAQGTGDAEKAFNALGINIKNSDGSLKGSDETLKEIAGRFSTFKDGAEKTALAVALFGKSGAQLIPFLNQGKKGIAELEAEAKKLGITLSSDNAAAANEFNDNIDKLKSAAGGFGNQLAIQLLPALVNLSQKLFDGVKGAEALTTAARIAATGVKLLASVGIIVVGVFKALGEALGGIAATVVEFFSGNFKNAFNTAKLVTKDFVGNIKGTQESLSALWDDSAAKIAANSDNTSSQIAAPIMKAEAKAKKSKDEILNSAKEIAEINKAILEEGAALTTSLLSPEDAYKAEVDRLNKLRNAFGVGVITVETYNKAIAEAQKTYNAASESVKEFSKNQEYLNSILQATPTAKLEKTRNDIALLYEALDKGDIVYQQFAEGVDVALGRSADSGEKTFTFLESVAKKAAENMQTAFADFLFDPFKSGVDGMLYDFVNVIKRMAAEALASQIFKSIATNFGGDTGFGAVVSAVFGGAKAGGGDVISGRSYLVGEQGPEMFVPRTTGTIMPSSSVTQAAPQVNVRNINVLDPSLVGDYLGTDSGEQLIMNVVQRNKRALAF